MKADLYCAERSGFAIKDSHNRTGDTLFSKRGY